MAEIVTARPLLTIAIPTFNRGEELRKLLAVLLPQLTATDEIEVLISDNASVDETEAIGRGVMAECATVRYVRQAENIGSDHNFLFCFAEARGTYFWLCGDDDIICPGSIAKVLRHLRGPLPVDMLYVTSYEYRQDYALERKEDPLRREFQSFTSAVRFARVVNIMFTFISGMIVNRERLLATCGYKQDQGQGTNLVQLRWSLPLLLNHRRSVVIWDRALAGHVGNAGGYSLGRVFGGGLKESLRRLLPGRRDLQRAILGPTLRRWLPAVLFQMRHSGNERIGLDTAVQDFADAYGHDPRYWLFAYPVMRLPLGAAKVWLRLSALVSHGIYVLSTPGFWRKRT